MSARTSNTNLDTEFADPAILEKVESQRAPGELTPVQVGSPALSTDERQDDAKLEEGSTGEPTAGGRAAISHRPTGFKVTKIRLFLLIFVVGSTYDFIFDRSFPFR